MFKLVIAVLKKQEEGYEGPKQYVPSFAAPYDHRRPMPVVGQKLSIFDWEKRKIVSVVPTEMEVIVHTSDKVLDDVVLMCDSLGLSDMPEEIQEPKVVLPGKGGDHGGIPWPANGRRR